MSTSRAARILRRTLVGGGLALVLGLLLWLASASWGPWLVAGVALLLAAVGTAEAVGMGAFGRACRGIPCALPTWVALSGATAWLVALRSTAAPWMRDLPALPRPAFDALGAALVALVLAGLAAAPSVGAGRSLWRTLSLSLWLAVPLSLLYLVRLDLGARGLAVVLVLSKVGDIAGYYVGNALGGRFPHHPFPKVSPNKTSVGCWASFLAGTLAGAAAVALGALPEARFGLASGLLGGALLNVAAQGGDLLESRVKRACGVKDSGSTFGPSGGVLDLVDSLLLSAPAVVLLWPALFRWPVVGA